MDQPIRNVERRYWRTDLDFFRNKKVVGRNIYVLLSNNPDRPSVTDPLIGTMESSGLAEDVVNSHNELLSRYGRRYPTSLKNLK